MKIAGSLAQIVLFCGCVVIVMVLAGVTDVGQSSTNTPEVPPAALTSVTVSWVKGLSDVTRIATSFICEGLEVTRPPGVNVTAPAPPKQSYILVKVRLPLLVLSCTSS